MEISRSEQGWVLLHKNLPVAVEGVTYFEKREDLVWKLYDRKLYVLRDGAVQIGGTPPWDDLSLLPAPSRGFTPEEKLERRRASQRRSERKRRENGKTQATVQAWREAHPEAVRQMHRRYYAKKRKP